MKMAQPINGSFDNTNSITKLKECRHGRMLFLPNDIYVGQALDVYGEFSEGEIKIFEQIVRQGDIVIDVGANIGAHTVRFAQLAGPQGGVMAFEPQRFLYYILSANIALNDLFNTHIHHAAVGRATGTINVPLIDYTGSNNFGGVSLTNASAGEKVSMLALDDLNLPSLRLLKVDVEGMESDVLEGARNLIMKHRPHIYVENDRDDKSEALITLIGELNYDMWWHLPPLFNPNNFANNPENIFNSKRGDVSINPVSINLLCIPKELNVSMQGFRKVTGPKDRWNVA